MFPTSLLNILFFLFLPTLCLNQTGKNKRSIWLLSSGKVEHFNVRKGDCDIKVWRRPCRRKAYRETLRQTNTLEGNVVRLSELET